jgi:hypothetical protein
MVNTANYDLLLNLGRKWFHRREFPTAISTAEPEEDKWSAKSHPGIPGRTLSAFRNKKPSGSAASSKE